MTDFLLVYLGISVAAGVFFAIITFLNDSLTKEKHPGYMVAVMIGMPIINIVVLVRLCYKSYKAFGGNIVARTYNYGIYARERVGPSGSIYKETFRTSCTRPLPEWGPVVCIHKDVPTLKEGDAMLHALKMIGYTEIPMKFERVKQ